MGMIRIETRGSFKHDTAEFSAMDGGHAAAVAEAIEWLSKEVLPEAIRNDHRCHNEDIYPRKGFAGQRDSAGVRKPESDPTDAPGAG